MNLRSRVVSTPGLDAGDPGSIPGGAEVKFSPTLNDTTGCFSEQLSELGLSLGT